MLQNLRDKAQGWMAWVIVGLICLTFVLFGAESLFRSSGDRKQVVVAKVNGAKISGFDLDTAYQQFIRQPANESVGLLDPHFVKKELLQSLIDETVLLHAAQDVGMRISPALIQSTLSTIPFLNQGGQFSFENYQQFLHNTQLTDRGFRALLRDSLLKQQLQQGIIQTSFSLPNELKELVKFFLQKRDFRYLTFAQGPFVQKVTITEDEIKKYYDEHQKDFMTNEEISLEYVHLSLDGLLKKYNPTEKELHSFYEQNLALFKEPEKVHVKHILVAVGQNADNQSLDKANERIKEIQQKLKEGQSFEKLASEYSEDKASAQNGGELGWFTRGEMVPKFENAAFALEKAGQISEPIRTQFGFHLIKLIEKQADKQKTFAQAKNDIIEKIKQQWAEEQLANMGDEMATLAYDHPDSLLPIAEKLSLPIEKTELFTQQAGPKEALLQQPAVLAAAFSASVKEDKNNSDILKLDDNSYLVVRAAKYISAKQKPLNDVTADIQDNLLKEKSQALAQQQAQVLYQQLTQSKKEELSAKLAQHSWQEERDAGRSTSNNELLEAVFSMPRPQNDEAVFQVAQLENGDSVLIWLTKVTDGSEDTLTAEQKENYQTALTQNIGQLEYALYATHLFKAADVKKFEERI